MTPPGGPAQESGVDGLLGLTALLAFQLVGEALVALLRWPLPGPVVGMALLFGALWAHGRVPRAVEAASTLLLRHLSLFFVPAGVGVLRHVGLLAADGLALGVAIGVSTIATLAVTAWVFERADAPRAAGEARER